jgi:hypothetical protein
MCCKWAGAKSMTEKITEGHGEGAVPKNAGAWKIFGSCVGLVALRRLEAYTFTILLFQLLLFNCF